VVAQAFSLCCSAHMPAFSAASFNVLLPASAAGVYMNVDAAR
jgi:hypothetical protein